MPRAGRVSFAWTVVLLIATFVSSTHAQDGRPARATPCDKSARIARRCACLT